MAIHPLPPEIATRIAAGEVVERPSSVVKELVENSLDAGATRVDVETRHGGRTYIRVRDDGEGIRRDEVTLAFQRHATSKLATLADLERIQTLGFRGEALASIAAVSRLLCTTRHVEEQVGTRIRLEGGDILSQTPIGRPPGTEMTVEDLFYNVPARRKFLRSDRTERRHIDAFLTRYAIAYPHVAFTLTHDGRTILSTPGNDDAREAILQVYGPDLGESLLPIPPELTAGQRIRVRGFVGPPTVHRANRGYITLFVNGRWIQDLRLTYAVIQAYHTLLPVKRYPVAFVMVELPPEEVDVNVHPTKAEVRFRDADAVFRALQRAVRATVVGDAPAAADLTIAPTTETPPAAPTAQPSARPTRRDIRARLATLTPAPRQLDLSPRNVPAAPTPTAAPQAEPAAPPPPPPPSLPPLRVIGHIATLFIIAEGPDGLYLIDQHAAHERVLYERMMAQIAKGPLPAQPLLEPVTVTLPPDAAAQLTALLPTLANLGLEVEPFGPDTFLVRALPAITPHAAPDELLADLAAADPSDRTPIEEAVEEAIVRRICKSAAVKGGQLLSHEEMERLVHDLERTANPRTCPHGRPIILRLSIEELARYFGRG